MRKARQMRAFLIADSLWRPVFALFGPRIPKSLRPNPRKLPFSGDSPGDRRINPLRARCGSALRSPPWGSYENGDIHDLLNGMGRRLTEPIFANETPAWVRSAAEAAQTMHLAGALIR
jgi:hypothetical protein